MLITADRVATGDALLEPGWVEVDGDRVVGVGAGSPPRPADRDLGDATVAPGFVDTHCHGGGGASLLGADPDAVATFVATHRAHGTTTVLASLVTGPLPDLERDVRALAEHVQDGRLAGIHLEGPWLADSRRGAHDAAQLRDPEPADVARLLDAGGGAVRMVTLAPERPGGIAAVRAVVGAGAVAAVGHTDATYEVARAAADAGATVATHLFNAMTPLGHRDPGPVGALLGDERVVVELVADGVHLHPAVVRLAARAAGPGRTSLVTDAMAAAGAGDGDYRLGALAVRVAGGVARLVGDDGAPGAIAGSTLTMDRALRFAVLEAGVPLADAVRAATRTPARALRLTGVGELAAGMRADLVVLDQGLRPGRVMAGGAWLPAPSG